LKSEGISGLEEPRFPKDGINAGKAARPEKHYKQLEQFARKVKAWFG
jgi:hypothetical protein